MTITVTAEGVLAICGVLGVIGAGLAVYIELAIRRAFDRLNGRYVRKELFEERTGDILRRLDEVA